MTLNLNIPNFIQIIYSTLMNESELDEKTAFLALFLFDQYARSHLRSSTAVTRFNNFLSFMEVHCPSESKTFHKL
ncbi:hypothetical protein [Dipodfec virus UA06Rod_19]|uniref:Uncharacterized protein n=1 Tax=Dipodfec virus UA06Rod_19 TaxID=2929319 RepID=A0A976R839_9VIRU|nr:hypothetical protein [Dipodfec virus UA06Rod_19]